MLTIFQAESDEHKDHVRTLFWEYLQWANALLNREFGVNFDIASMLERDMAELAKFAPPHGRLLLAQYDNEIVGMACLRKLDQDSAEVKRMYAQQPFRGKGIGRSVIEQLIAEARQSGYARILLDSAGFMHAAHAMYRAAGFQEIEAYQGSEIPPEFQGHWIFMEKSLEH